MGLLRNIISRINPAQPNMAKSEGKKSVPTQRTYSVIKAYRDIEIINRSVELIVSACTEVPLIIDGPKEYKKINKLLNRMPNPWEDRSRIFRRAFLDYMLYGNAFFYFDGSNLYHLPAQSITVKPHTKFFIESFEYDTFHSITGRDKKITFSFDEVIQVVHENESSIFVGKSPINSCIRLIKLYNHMVDFQSKFFQNNAVPGLVLQTDNALSERIRERLLATWTETYNETLGGGRKPAILDAGLKISDFSTVNFTELDFENSIERIQQDMAKALGVPYVLMKSGNDANIEANQRLFYLHTVIPIVSKFANAFQRFFNLPHDIRPDRLAVPCLQPDNKTQATYYSTLVNGGIMTPNEAREGLRLDKMGGCDKIREPQNITGSAVDPAQGGRPPKDDADKKGKDNNGKDSDKE